MKKIQINGITVEINYQAIKKFLNQITYPIAIVDFETFRTLNAQYHFSLPIENDFLEKIFSVSILIITKPEHLTIANLTKKKLKLFSKTQLSNLKDFPTFDSLLAYQTIFFNYLITKLLKYHVKSLVFLGSRTEINLLKNYLAYFYDEPKFKNKISYFFHQKAIYDVYDLWNRDEMINLPQYKVKKNNQVGATKKTLALIKNNDDYWRLLKPQPPISNNDIGRIVDQYFSNNISLLKDFLFYVNNHNQNDVLIGATILSLLYLIINQSEKIRH